MSLEDSLAALSDEAGGMRPSEKCGIESIRVTLSDSEWQLLSDLLENPRSNGKLIPAARLVQALRENGVEMSIYTIRRHRRRATGTGCVCPL